MNLFILLISQKPAVNSIIIEIKLKLKFYYCAKYIFLIYICSLVSIFFVDVYNIFLFVLQCFLTFNQYYAEGDFYIVRMWFIVLLF